MKKFTNKKFLFFILLTLVFFTSNAQSKGDIAFVGFNTDNPDSFAIVALADIAANLTIYFTDSDWDETANAGAGAFVESSGDEDSFLTWGTGASIISAGTIVTFTS